MDLKSTPLLTDPVPTNKSRLGLYSSLLSCPPPASSFPSALYLTNPWRKPIPGKLDDVRANSCLDAMKSSSPRKMLIKDSNIEAVSDENDAAYHLWVLKYPSALTSFEQIMKCAEGKLIALFMDYDGTLSPIVDDPDAAIMSSEMREAVRDVANYFPTAIISGRCRDKVYEFIGLPQLYYAGSHGMDIMGSVTRSVSVSDHPNSIRSTDNLPLGHFLQAGKLENLLPMGKEVNLFQPASEFIPMINEVFCSLIEKTKGIEGAKVENNKFCVSVHYRLVDENNWTTVAQCVHDILKDYPRLRLTHGRKVLEVRPMINWDKGKAVEFLLESLGLSNCDDVLPIYVGDDRSDEDAFKVLREGNQGYGILVSSVPKESNAFYSLRDPSEVMDFLKSIVKWKKSAGL